MPKKGSEFDKRDHTAPDSGERSIMAIGERLRRTRMALGKTQAQLCRETDIGANTYTQYESGVSRPTVANALRLVDKYELSLDWIYRGETNELKSGLLAKINAANQ